MSENGHEFSASTLQAVMERFDWETASPRQRAVFRQIVGPMYFYEKSTGEIARELSISPQSVRTTLEKLRRDLEES